MGRVIGFDNFDNDVRSYLKNENTAERTYTFPDVSGNVKLTNCYIVGSITDLQTYLSALSAGADVNIWFPAGTYSVTTPITINDKGRVRILSEGAVLTNGLTATGAVFDIDVVTELWVHGVKVNMNLNTFTTTAFDVKDVQGIVRFVDVDLFSFNSENNIGIRLENAPRNAANNAGFPYPGAIFDNCNFYNALTQTAGFDYNSNNSKGIGIYLYNLAEYFKISNCGFVGVGMGIWIREGANGLITNSQFLWTLARWSATNYGAIYIESNGTNEAKLSISNCKFNHNWSYCIFSNVNTATARPVSITGCDFIANAIRPIGLSGSSDYNYIANNYFNASNGSQTATNTPFTATACNYILTQGTNTIIESNRFTNNTSSQAAILSATTADRLIIRDNLYENGLTLTSLVGSNNLVYRNTTTTGIHDVHVRIKTSAVAVNATATITAAQMATGLITSTSAAGVTITTPTATQLATQMNASQGYYYDLIIDNSAGANNVTLSLGSGFTQAVAVPNGGSGNLVVASGAAGVGIFRIYFKSATAATISRIM